MLIVDTNVLIYAADFDSPFHERCRSWLETQRSRADAWYCTWPILYEFLRVTTHPRVMRNPWTGKAAWSFIQSTLSSPGLSLLESTPRHAEVLSQLIEEMGPLGGSIFHDAHTVVLMREHGLRQIVTHDADFHRFKGVEVFDPIAA